MDNDTELLVDDSSRFEVQPGEVEFLDNNGQSINGDLKEYFDQQRKANLTFTEKLNVGDIIKIKWTGQVVVVKYVDYQVNESIKVDYAGSLYNVESEDLILFGQDDIEKKYSMNIEELQAKLR